MRSSLTTVAWLPVPPPLRFVLPFLLIGRAGCIVVLGPVIVRFRGGVIAVLRRALLCLTLLRLTLLWFVVSVLWCLNGFEVDVFLPLGVCLMCSLALVL